MKSLFLKAKFLDIATGNPWIITVNEQDAKECGIKEGDRLIMEWNGNISAVSVDLTDSLVKKGEVAFFEDIMKRLTIKKNNVVEFRLLGRLESMKAIQKKLLDKKLSYEEIYSIISDIVNHKLNDVAVAFFISSTFFGKISKQELYYFTKAMAETGHIFDFKGKVVDKHSVGGLCGNRVSLIMTPTIASLGIRMPKTSSRAVTSASGTADTMEVLAPVNFKIKEIEKIVKKTNACLVWGSQKIAPADNRIIDVAYQLSIEPFSKLLVSIMAKKIAAGAKYLLIDIPVNPTAKVKTLKQAKGLKSLFLYVCKKFGINVKVIIYPSPGPVGKGIGPALEARDVLRILQRKKNGPLDLEKKAIYMTGQLLELVGKAKKGKGEKLAQQYLDNKQSWKKFQEIIKAQGGNPDIDSEDIKIGNIIYKVKASKKGKIKAINDSNLSEIARHLGTPFIKEAGIYLDKFIGDKTEKGETICTLYSTSKFRLNLALSILKKYRIYEIGN